MTLTLSGVAWRWQGPRILRPRPWHIRSCWNWVSPPCTLTLRVGPNQLAKKAETGVCNRMRSIRKPAPFRSGEDAQRALKGSVPPPREDGGGAW